VLKEVTLVLDENVIAELAQRKVVTDTFRRLSPEKKEHIYRTAIKLLGKYGHDGLVVDRFCRDAGISKGSFFQYFPSKSHLLEFTLLIFDSHLARWMDEVKAEEPSALARERILHLYRKMVIESKLDTSERRFYHFVTNATHHSALTIEGVDLTRHVDEYVAEIVERGVETGEIRRDFDVTLTGHCVSLFFGALVSREYLEQGMLDRHMEECLISSLFDGIRG
jgi:AcrR family transcriptional regulator